MDIELLKRHFAKIGATLAIDIVTPQTRPRHWGRQPDFTLDVADTRQGQQFVLEIQEDRKPHLNFSVVDTQPEQRHLLLLLKRSQAETDQRKEKFLCGHDERHWFVAGVSKAGVATVDDAMDSLKPRAVLQEQMRKGVKRKNWHKRRNAGFIRQGEWFFLPQPTFVVPDPRLIMKNEPIRRSGGKPHIVENMYRMGGETVYVSSRYPQGLPEHRYQALIKRNRKRSKDNWQVMRRQPTVFAKGKIRHPDHKTINLPFWHQVIMNSEEQNSINIVFLD